VIDDMTLWHHRYGHLTLDSLKVLKQRNMVIGLPIINVDKNICEGCIMGKMHRFLFTKLLGVLLPRGLKPYFS